MYRIALRSSRQAGLRSLRAPFSTSVVRRDAGPQYQPPSPPPANSSGNAHRDFYKSFGRPTAKVFLIAWATYQILYWSWAKLEFMEEKEEKEEEIKRLESVLDTAVRDKNKERSSLAATSAAGVAPVEPLADQASSSKGWFKFY